MPKKKNCPWLRLRTVAEQFGVDYDTVLLWTRRGVLTPDGPVKLQVRKIGGLRLTRQEWVDAFLAALNKDDAPPVMAETPSAAQRRAQREQKMAAKMLRCNHQKRGA